jgi:hypothetical protein
VSKLKKTTIFTWYIISQHFSNGWDIDWNRKVLIEIEPNALYATWNIYISRTTWKRFLKLLTFIDNKKLMLSYNLEFGTVLDVYYNIKTVENSVFFVEDICENFPNEKMLYNSEKNDIMFNTRRDWDFMDFWVLNDFSKYNNIKPYKEISKYDFEKLSLDTNKYEVFPFPPKLENKEIVGYLIRDELVNWRTPLLYLLK